MLKSCLYQVSDDVYCCDEFYGDVFYKVEQKALTYFYRSDNVYIYTSLVDLLAREFSLKWEGFPEKV